MPTKTTALLDGDIFIFESATRGERKHDLIDGVECVVLDPEYAVHNLQARIATVKEHCEADEVVVALSDPGRIYFRHGLWPAYKSHRKGKPPALIKHLRAWIEEHHKCYWKPHLEADDVLGILGTHPTWVRGAKVICTADKDLLQIPGFHLNPRKLDEGIREVTREQGEAWHLIQTLCGDTADFYPGCPRTRGFPRTGPITAKVMIEDGFAAAVETLPDRRPRQVWNEVVVPAFVARGATPADALVQARVARILQARNWDNTNQEIIEWNP